MVEGAEPFEPVEIIRSAALEGIAHGFLGRRGGVIPHDASDAEGSILAGLNVGLGAGDDPDIVAQNRLRAADAVMPGARLVSVYQVHSADAVVVTEPWPEDDRPHADAVVTREKGLVLGIVTADCAPVLFADATAGVIGAAHAGWRGAHGGVLEATLDAMEQLGAQRSAISCAIGPCIAQASYEVDDGFKAQFSADDEAFFAPGKPDHWQFDLAGYAAHRLVTAGAGRVENLALDTYADADRFYSYRRATHRQEPTYGRQFSLIGLPKL